MTYKKQQWKTGEIITEGKLNHIEDGIYNTDSDLTESKTLFASNILDLQTNKANQSDVVSINQEITNISADLSAAEADILTKAAQADVDIISNDVDTLQTQVTTNTNNIKSLQDNAVNKSELDSKQDKLTAGNNITIVDNVISATTSGGEVPEVTGTKPIVVSNNNISLSIGDGLSIADDKLVNNNPTPYELPIASSTTLGGIKVGDNLSISDDGTLNATDTTYSAGDNITIVDGVISATGGSSTPDNMVTTDTAQTISGYKTFDAGINVNTHLLLPSAIKSGRVNIASAYMFTSSGIVRAQLPIFQLYTPDAESNTILQIGGGNQVRFNASSVINTSNQFYLHQGNITAGDNISIENTDTGIKISSTSTGGGSSDTSVYSFGMSQYYKGDMNNISWLKSTGTYYNKSSYPSFYAWILNNQTNSKDGFKLSTDSDITDYDFVINTTDETFRLPLLNGQEDLVSDKYEDLSLGSSGMQYTAPGNGWLILNKVSSGSNQEIRLTNTNNSMRGYAISPTNTAGLSAEVACRKGDLINIYYSAGGATENFRFIYSQGNGNLYYYCGNVTTNQDIIDLAAIVDNLGNMITVHDVMPDLTAKVSVSAYTSSSNQYTAPTDGWIAVTGGQTGRPLQIYINDNIILNTNIINVNWSNSFIVPIPKGSKFYAINQDASAGGVTCSFFPCIGGTT